MRLRARVKGGLAAALIAVLNGCGSEGPVTPPPARPTSSPTTTPGGTVRGRYVFRLEPAAECRAPRASLSFRVDASAADGDRPGVRLVQEGAGLAGSESPILEMELLYETPNLQGSIATMPWRDAGVASVEGPHLWIQGIAVGAVATGAAGVGEVAQGTAIADLSFGRDANDRDGLGGCVAGQHRWSLRVQ